MKFSANPEWFVACMEFPFSLAARFVDDPDSVASRHYFETAFQTMFYNRGVDAYIRNGVGSISKGHFLIDTDRPAAVLREIKRYLKGFKINGERVCISNFLQIAWYDSQDKILRSFEPADNRPFWTYLRPPLEIIAYIERGRAIREQREPLECLVNYPKQ